MDVSTPSTLDRKRGKMLITISLETSLKKLVRLTAQTLRGSERMPVSCDSVCCVIGFFPWASIDYAQVLLAPAGVFRGNSLGDAVAEAVGMPDTLSFYDFDGDVLYGRTRSLGHNDVACRHVWLLSLYLYCQ